MGRLLLLVLALAACDSGSKPAATGSGSAQPPVWMSELPRVVRTPALLAADSDGVLLLATPHGIVVEGKTIVSLDGGAVAPEDKEGGAHGRTIGRLAKFLAALKLQLGEHARKNGRAVPDGPLLVAMDRTLPFQLLVEILSTAKQKDVGYKTFHLLVTDSHVPVAIPLTLPDNAATASVKAGPTPSAPTNGPYSRISPGEVAAATDTSLTPQNVLHKLQSSYMAGVKRCYTNALKRDATLKGSLKLTLTVNETGRAVKTEAKGFDTEVDACINGMMTSWRFPIPKDNDGEAVSATFSITLLFVPDDESAAAKAKQAQAADKADQEAAAKLADSLRGGPSNTGEGSANPPEPLLQDPDRMPLGLVVSVAKDKLLVWSISGMEGTLSSPRLDVALSDPTSMKQLNALLAEIVTRRWEGRDRPPATNAIIVMADPATRMQSIADVFVAVRSTVDGTKLLFPDIQLSTGFE